MAYLGMGVSRIDKKHNEIFKKQKDRSHLHTGKRKRVIYTEEEKAAFSEELKEKYGSNGLGRIKPILLLLVLGIVVLFLINAFWS